jgi:KEOPS complex subunit Pcc1
MKHEAEFRIRCKEAERIYASVSPETLSEVNPRSKVSCFMEGPETCVLSVKADDIPALRAAINMWLRLINVAGEMQELIP